MIKGHGWMGWIRFTYLDVGLGCGQGLGRGQFPPIPCLLCIFGMFSADLSDRSIRDLFIPGTLYNKTSAGGGGVESISLCVVIEAAAAAAVAGPNRCL